MSIKITLKNNSGSKISYTPSYLSHSLSDIMFFDTVKIEKPYHEYPPYKGLNLFTVINFDLLSKFFIAFESKYNNPTQENLKEYFNNSTTHQHSFYNSLYSYLKGRVASIYHSMYDYVYEDEVQKSLKYVVNNLFTLYKQYNDFTKLVQQNSLQGFSHRAFNSFAKHLVSSNNILYANSQYKTLKSFKLHMYYSDEKYKEVRSNVPEFIPAGTCCTYSKEIFINTHHWNVYRKIGSMMRLRLFYHTYLHELGHAVDYPRENVKLLNQATLCPKNQEISQYPGFLKYVKRSYVNKKKIKTKKNGYLSYYVCPKFEINKKITKKKNLISIDWSRASQEAFAESFGYLCYWYLNGIDKADILFIDGTHYKKLIIIKTLLPVLNVLALQLNWELIGIPKHLIHKNKKIIMAYLEYVDNLEHKPRNTNTKSMRSSNVKKPTLQKLLRKKLK